MRLIDADALMQKLIVSPCGSIYREYDCDNFPVTLALKEVKSMVRNTLTVSPWVKTADRLPTKANGEILAINKYGLNLLPYYRVVELSDVYTWWMAIPPLPEVEEQEPYPGDDLDCPNCGAMLALVDGKMLECPLCGFSDNDTAEVEE